jgi:hypothetical protein
MGDGSGSASSSRSAHGSPERALTDAVATSGPTRISSSRVTLSSRSLTGSSQAGRTPLLPCSIALPSAGVFLSARAAGRSWELQRDAAHRALTQLERNQELRDNLGENAPDLNAAHMHAWVWGGARSMWESAHYRGAVSAAAVKVNAETQNKVNRRELSETKLF